MMEIITCVLVGIACLFSLVTLICVCSKKGKDDSKEIKDLSEKLQSLEIMRGEINGQIKTLQVSVSEQMRALSEQQAQTALKDAQTLQNTLDTFSKQVNALTQNLDTRMQDVRHTMENRLTAMQDDNNKKLDAIRGTVDEKLQKTLDEKLATSFKTVSERLEQVYKSLGEMQHLANGVDDLKKVLSNSKNMGIVGEYQLDGILDDFLAPSQYEKNIVTKKGSKDPVEFAVKLPAKDEDNSYIYLPIDSKFPLEKYRALLTAYDSNSPEEIKFAKNQLDSFIKENAKKIQEKYIDPPNTTDFAILFLPTEGLYAEVVKNPDLVESVSKLYHINIAGPSTISALLNSLQMGFRTLAIQKRSNEVWKILGAVKTEFGKFNKELEALQKNLEHASTNVSTLLSTRTRMMMSKLRKVEELDEEETKLMLDEKEDTEE